MNQSIDVVDVSVIIVNYNTKELLRACLNSLYDQTRALDYEIIVVDNHSQDGSLEMLQENFSGVVMLALPENIGFGRANNEGIKIARGRNIFLLNPDTLLVNNAIKILSDFLDEHEDVGVCGGNLYTKNLQPTHSYMLRIPSLLGELNNMLFGYLYRWYYGSNIEFNFTEKPIEVGYVTGADMMIRKSVLDEVGGFDVDFFMYFEETELSWRIRKAGYRIMNVPHSKIIHLEGQSITLKENRENMFLASRRLFFQKIYSCRIQRWLCQVIYGAGALLQILYFSCYRRDKDMVRLWKYRFLHF